MMSVQGNQAAPGQRVPSAIFLALGAIAGAVAITGAVRDFGVGPRILAAVAGGAVAYGLLKGRGTSFGWSHIFNVALSAGCGLFAVWALADSDSPKAAASAQVAKVRLVSPRAGFTFSGDHFNGVRGTVSGLRPGETLWLMVQTAEGDDRPYAMSTPCSTEAGGRFSCPPAYAGVPEVTKHHFRIMVRVFDSSTVRQVVGDWVYRLEHGKHSLSYGAPLGRPGASVVVYRAA